MNSAQSTALLQLLLKYRWVLLSGALLSAIMGWVLTGPVFQSPLYKSVAVIYPPSTTTSRNFIENVPRFGGQLEIEEQLQVLKSTRLRDSVISALALHDHFYPTDSGEDQRYRVKRSFTANISFSRTQHNAIQIEVHDSDPEMAAVIADEIIKQGDLIRGEILRENIASAYSNLNRELAQEQMVLQSLEDSLQVIMDEPGSPEINLQLERLRAHYSSELRNISTLKYLMEQTNNDLVNDPPGSYVISPPEPALKPFSPRRKVSAALAGFCGFMVIALFLGSFDWLKQSRLTE